MSILSIVDASNLERNLYLVSQVFSLGLPTVVALNMVDWRRDRSIEIDVAALEKRLGVPVIAVQANRRTGIDELQNALATAAASKQTGRTREPVPGRISAACDGNRHVAQHPFAAAVAAVSGRAATARW